MCSWSSVSGLLSSRTPSQVRQTPLVSDAEELQTVGCKPMAYFGTPGYRIVPRSDSRQYQHEVGLPGVGESEATRVRGRLLSRSDVVCQSIHVHGDEQSHIQRSGTQVLMLSPLYLDV